MAENQRIIGSFRKEEKSSTLRRNHLLIIGIDQYDNDIPKLNNAVRDANAFQEVLMKNFQFEAQNITSLFDQQATKKNILATFDQLLEQLTDQDNLVLYFSGHGELHEVTDRGYWIPVDAVNGDRSTFLSNSEVVDFFKFCKAHHIFSVIDSCFSGSLFEANRGNTVQERLDNIPSRWLLTAGRKEPVSDGALGKNSPFATSLLVHLRNNEEGSLWCSDLCNRVLRAVSFNSQDQTPRGEPLQNVGHQGGQFVFYKKDYIPKEKPNEQEPETGTLKGSSSSMTTESKPQTFDELKQDLKRRVAMDIGQVFDPLNNMLNPNSKYFNLLIVQQSSYNGISKNIREGIIEEKDARTSLNQITKAVTSYIDKFGIADLKPEFIPKSKSASNEPGNALHHLEELEQKELREQAEMLQRKLNLIRKKRVLEDDPSRKFKLEIDEKEAKQELEELKKLLK